MLDFIIIGGGLSGLYMAYLLKTTTNASFIVLEKSERFGGRARDEKFAGISVPTGAGIGRKVPDQLLIQLMRQLNLPVHFFPVQHHYSPRINPVDIDYAFQMLRTNIPSENRFQPIRTTFKSFATHIWGKKFYEQFLIYNGYRDMEQEDVYETLEHYRISDNYKKWMGFSVEWNELVQRLCRRIGYSRLQRNQNIYQIKPIKFNNDSYYNVYTLQHLYTCKHIIFATPPEVIGYFFPSLRSLYSNIGTQPFLRTYVQFDSNSTEIIKQYISGTTIVSNLLQKIIPINPKKGVYMIAYSDNRNAVLGKNLTKEQIIQKLVREFNIPEQFNLKIIQLQHYFWKIGTHYYKPLDSRFSTRKQYIQIAQHPIVQRNYNQTDNHIYVIGDWISENQGWVEGALESVQNVQKWIKRNH